MTNKKKNIVKIGKEVIRSEISALKKLEKAINSSFVKVVESILNAKGNIVFTGVGKSKLILEKTCGTFSSLGITSYILDPTAANHGDLGRLQQKDIIIIASNSGNSKEFESILKFAKSNTIKTIGITSNNKSQLYKHADINILYSRVKEAGDKNYSLVPTCSTTVLTALGDAIAIAVASRKNFKLSHFGKYHPSGSIGKSLTKVLELIIPKSKLPFVSENEKFSKILIKIASAKLGCVLIQNSKTKKINIITDGDAARAAKKFTNINDVLAKDIMTKNPTFVEYDMLATEALKILNKKKINVLLIRNKSKFIGLVALHSLLNFLEYDKKY